MHKYISRTGVAALCAHRRAGKASGQLL